MELGKLSLVHGFEGLGALTSINGHLEPMTVSAEGTSKHKCP